MAVQDNPFSLKASQVYAVTILFYSIVYMVLMVLPFYSLTIGASKSEIGLVMGVTMLVSMFARPIAGNMIDRYGTGKVFVIALLIFAISLSGYFLPNIWIFGMVRAIQGAVAAFFSTAMEIITMDLLSERMRAQGLSLYSLATMIPTTFGPILALLLKNWMPMFWIFFLFFMMGIGNFIFGLLVSRQVKSQTERNFFRNLSHSGSWKNRVLLLSSSIMLLASIANGAIFTFLPLYLEQNGSTFAEIYFLIHTLVLVFSRFWGRKCIPSDGTIPYRVLFITLILASIGTMIIGVSLLPIWLFAAAICNGVAFALLYPALLTYVSFSVSQQNRGFLIGLFIGAADLGFSLGALAMGPIADVFSYSSVFISCAVCCLLSMVLILGYRKNQQKEQQKELSCL